MKVLVYQCKIGNGSIWSQYWDKGKCLNFYGFETNVAIPSVKKWAEKCGYDYAFYDKSTVPVTGFFTGDNDPIGYIVCERLMHMVQPDYDYVLYIDTDIYIKENAPAFEFKPGLSICFEYDWYRNVSHDERYYKYYNITKEQYKYLNSGVFAIDSETAKFYFDYSMKRLHSLQHSNCWLWDQDFPNHFQIHHNDKMNYIGEEWNYDCREITDDAHTVTFEQANFYHFCGKAKEQFKSTYKKIIKGR
jgi:hypothetical protein